MYQVVSVLWYQSAPYWLTMLLSEKNHHNKSGQSKHARTKTTSNEYHSIKLPERDPFKVTIKLSQEISSL